ncbi:hypothetical protein RCS94_02700 [Orbaceae bacterium ac157xtp]
MWCTHADAFSMDTRMFEWIDSNNNVILPSNYSQTLGCGSGLNLPLTLKITLPNIKVHSWYGNPNESLETNLVKTYKIGTMGICFAKPNSLDWWGSEKPSSTEGGGYTSDFDPVNGFKVSANPKFPTTGFSGAEFTLVMIGNPTDYTFTHNGGSAVTVDGTTGKVTLNSKPSGPVTIEARYNNAPPTAQPDEYTFDPRTVWVVPKGFARMTYETTKTECGTGVIDGVANTLKIPTRVQLTNSPLNNLGMGEMIITNYYTRAVGGGVFGEWGLTSGLIASSNYPDSQWNSSNYWTRDPWSSSVQFGVNSRNGFIYYNIFASIPNVVDNNLYVACLE